VKRRAVAWLLAGSFLVAVAFVAVWWMSPGVEVRAWRSGPPPAPWAAWERQEELWREEGLHRKPECVYAPLSRIGPRVALAVLVGEDISFFDHGAIDVRAVGEAFETWWRGGRLRGASTVSQQLAKSLFLSPERSLSRKLVELRLAWWLVHSLGRPRVLELYLNVVEFGPGVFGAEAGARRYYGLSAADLSDEQAAGLAAAVPAPGRDNPATGSERWRFRRDTILRRMNNAEWLEQRLEALTGGPRRSTLVIEGRPH
jgi:monofunctional glycosyltransferase